MGGVKLEAEFSAHIRELSPLHCVHNKWCNCVRNGIVTQETVRCCCTDTRMHTQLKPLLDNLTFMIDCRPPKLCCSRCTRWCIANDT